MSWEEVIKLIAKETLISCFNENNITLKEIKKDNNGGYALFEIPIKKDIKKLEDYNFDLNLINDNVYLWLEFDEKLYNIEWNKYIFYNDNLTDLLEKEIQNVYVEDLSMFSLCCEKLEKDMEVKL